MKRMILRQIPTLIQTMKFRNVEIMKIIVELMNATRAS